MREFKILNHLGEVVKTVEVNTILKVEDVIYELKEYHGFNMVYTYEEVLQDSNLDEQLKEVERKEKSELEQIDIMIAKLKEIKASIKKRDKLSDKAFNMNHITHSIKAIQKTNTNLNWECMHLDKCKTGFARLFKGSLFDVSTDEKEYNPSGFHKYKG